MHDEQNSMLYWWPIVSDLKVPMPRTQLIAVPQEFDWYNINPDKSVTATFIRLIHEAGDELGWPAFIRGDLTSGKHEWAETCYLESPEKIVANLHGLYAATDIALIPPPAAIAVREFLTLDAPFRAFMGLPIARERRFFVDDGKIVCNHAYWPEDAIWFGQLAGHGTVETPGWQAILRHLNEISISDAAQLHIYAAVIGNALGGSWSVDFAHTNTGEWVFIDAAKAGDSWHPEHEGE